MKIKIVKGDLIKMALDGEFDVIAHGCNCFCTQKAGIAKNMVKAFATDTFFYEGIDHYGDINKLGNIDPFMGAFENGKWVYKLGDGKKAFNLIVVNCYTQYYHAKNMPAYMDIPFDYSAFRLCMRKLSAISKNKRIGIPWIGCKLGGAERWKVYQIIKEELLERDVTIVQLEDLTIPNPYDDYSSLRQEFLSKYGTKEPNKNTLKSIKEELDREDGSFYEAPGEAYEAGYYGGMYVVECDIRKLLEKYW